ncbi:MAG: hypothetical protein FWF91_02110 [Coriobacteriia bacterium]|nr:hypothetical protein [Coriobacteriia bacterium]
MLNDLLLNPPVVFIILLAVIGLLAFAAKALAIKGTPTAGKGEPYACGQDVPTGKIQPGYSDFFHFAFLFTILEVVALIVGTVTANAIWLTLVILCVVVLAIFILFRRD